MVMKSGGLIWHLTARILFILEKRGIYKGVVLVWLGCGNRVPNLSLLGKKFRTEMDDIIPWILLNRLEMETVSSYKFL